MKFLFYFIFFKPHCWTTPSVSYIFLLWNPTCYVSCVPVVSISPFSYNFSSPSFDPCLPPLASSFPFLIYISLLVSLFSPLFCYSQFHISLSPFIYFTGFWFSLLPSIVALFITSICSLCSCFIPLLHLLSHFLQFLTSFPFPVLFSSCSSASSSSSISFHLLHILLLSAPPATSRTKNTTTFKFVENPTPKLAGYLATLSGPAALFFTPPRKGQPVYPRPTSSFPLLSAAREGAAKRINKGQKKNGWILGVSSLRVSGREGECRRRRQVYQKLVRWKRTKKKKELKYPVILPELNATADCERVWECKGWKS